MNILRLILHNQDSKDTGTLGIFSSPVPGTPSGVDPFRLIIA